ncbi:hypothetical protein [Tahibacter harae]|uniref:Uncharacterized protein n=1 Tax=Tahibacter harae TaxID=2963937 RepID=A0ABT1QP72_9GAMM|nr:hypothetical protein [Tahibacter harae]MCQ4164086.1 hypothetical protein [Tahibacter harae]
MNEPGLVQVAAAMPTVFALAVLTLLHALIACWAVRSLWPRARAKRLSAGPRRASTRLPHCSTEPVGKAAAGREPLRADGRPR